MQRIFKSLLRHTHLDLFDRDLGLVVRVKSGVLFLSCLIDKSFCSFLNLLGCLLQSVHSQIIDRFEAPSFVFSMLLSGIQLRLILTSQELTTFDKKSDILKISLFRSIINPSMISQLACFPEGDIDVSVRMLSELIDLSFRLYFKLFSLKLSCLLRSTIVFLT